MTEPQFQTRKQFNFDLRPLFRKLGKEIQREYSNAIAASRPPKAGGKTGGSLVRRVLRSTLLKVRNWGFVFKLHSMGQELTWFVRGTTRQEPRPISVEVDEDKVAAAVELEAQRQFSSFDRDQHA